MIQGGTYMKLALIITGVVVAGFLLAADQVGSYCQDINPYAPEDYPRYDAGQDF